MPLNKETKQNLYSIKVHKVINVLLWFCKFVALCGLPNFVVAWHHCYNELSTIIARCLVFFWVLLLVFSGLCSPRGLLVLLILFSCYLSIQNFCFVLFSYFTSKFFCFFCLQLLICPCALAICLSVEVFFVILECRVLFILLDPVSVPFPFYRFADIFRFISSICVDTNIPSQNGPGSNGNEGITPHSPEIQNWSLTTRYKLVPYPGYPFLGRSLLHLQRV